MKHYGNRNPESEVRKENTRPTYAFSTSRESIDIARDLPRVKGADTQAFSEVENAEDQHSVPAIEGIKKEHRKANALEKYYNSDV